MSKSKQGTSKRWAKKHSAIKARLRKECQQATQATRRQALKAERGRHDRQVTFKPPFAENEYLLDPELLDTKSVTVTPKELGKLLDSSTRTDLPVVMYQFELKNKNTGKKFFVGPAATEDEAKELAVAKGFAKSVAPLSFCSAEVW